MRVRLMATGALGALAVGLGGATPAAADPPPMGPVACDRACLKGLIDQYLAAVVAHDPKRLPLAPDARYTENGQALAFGDGFWATASGVGTYRHDFLDPRTQQAGYMGVLKENGSSVILALRLKLEGRQISEVETIIGRSGLGQAGPTGAATLEAMGRPDEVWLKDTPVGQRQTREDIVRVSNMYFTGLQNNDGKGDYPFTDDCYRLENGLQTTSGPHKIAPPPPSPGAAPPPKRSGPDMFNLGCKAGFETGYFRIVTRIRDRRFPIVDEDKGVAMAFGFFDHSGAVREYPLSDGTIVKGGITAPFTWEIAEAFRIEKGKIRVVEAVLNNVPYGNKGGWEGK